MAEPHPYPCRHPHCGFVADKSSMCPGHHAERDLYRKQGHVRYDARPISHYAGDIESETVLAPRLNDPIVTVSARMPMPKIRKRGTRR